MKVERFVTGIISTNCYLAVNEETKKAVIVDPAACPKKMLDYIEEQELKIEAILLTHGHFDHIWGLDALRDAANGGAEGLEEVKAYACEEERELLKSARLNVSAQAGRACETYADEYVKDGQEITLAGMTCRVIATPGHTAGGCCYYFEEAGILVAGDTLFQESVGRTDLATGSMSALTRSVKEKLFLLPDETKVYPGHGESTTIGHEKEYNPFIQ